MKIFTSSHLLSTLGLAVLFLTQCSPSDIDTFIRPGGGTQYLAGYGPPPSPRPSGSHATFRPQGYWDGDYLTGKAKIRIVRNEQKAYFYIGDTLAGVSPISSGDLDHTTPPGNYKVTEKDIDHTSSRYGLIKNKATGQIVNNNADIRKDKPGPGEVYEPAPMPYFLRFNNSIGMHTGYLPGYAASHGCVRLPNAMAKKFYEHAKIGTPVIVE